MTIIVPVLGLPEAMADADNELIHHALKCFFPMMFLLITSQMHFWWHISVRLVGSTRHTRQKRAAGS